MIGYHTSIDMKHMYFQYYSRENNPHFYYQYHSVESHPHCIYLHIQYIYIYMYMALSQQTETSLCDHHHPLTRATPWGYRVSFDLTVPGRKALSEAYELRWETSPPVWWDKEKRTCRCEISLKWKLVNCWVDNSWVFWFVLFFCLNFGQTMLSAMKETGEVLMVFCPYSYFFSRITSWNVIPHLFHIGSILGIWSNVFLFWWGWNHLQFERSLNCGCKHVEVESRCYSQRLFKISHKPSPTGSIPTSSFSQLGRSVLTSMKMVYVNLGCSGCTLKGWSHQCLTTISLYTQISRGTWNNEQRSDGIFWRQLILWTTLPEWVRLIVWETFGVTLLVQATRRFDFRIGKKGL